MMFTPAKVLGVLVCLTAQHARRVAVQSGKLDNVTSSQLIALGGDLTKSGSKGGGGGSSFDHYNRDGLAGAISEICVRSGSRVDRLEVNYAGREKRQGGGGGSRKCFPLNGDVITEVRVWSGKSVDAIQFKTAGGRTSGKYGGGGGGKTTWKAPTGKHLMSFYGNSGSRLDKVGVFWGTGGGTGRWTAIRSCIGCGEGSFEIEECSERSTSSSTELSSSWSAGVTSEMSAGFEYQGVTGGGSKSISGSYSRSTVSLASESFVQTRCTTRAFSCDKNFLWQWSFTSNFDGYGAVLTMGADKVCTDESRPCCLPGTFTEASGPRNCVLDPTAPNTC